jgi:hypothetical protein
MPNLLTVNPGQIILADAWNGVVNDLNNLTGTLTVDNYKVGINNTTPRESLEIGEGFTFHSGGAKFIADNLYYQGGSDRYIADGPASQIRMGGGTIRLLTAAAGDEGNSVNINPGGLTVASNGNVGIGTNAPLAKLEISDGGPLWTTNGWNKAIKIANGNAIHFDAGSSNNTPSKFGIGATDSGDALYFFHTTAEGQEDSAKYRLKINGNGNVEVGVRLPEDPQTVARFQVRQSGNTEWAGEFRNGSGQGKGLLVRAATSNSPAALFETQLWDGTSRFKVQANGKIYVLGNQPLIKRVRFNGSMFPPFDTQYSSDIYEAAIVGFTDIGADSRPNPTVSLYLTNSGPGSTWKIAKTGNLASSQVDVLFIRREICG